MDATPDDYAPGRGRPPKLTEPVLEAAVRLLAGGNFRETVAKLVGVHPATFRSWMASGRRLKAQFPGSIYARFHAGVLHAEAAGEAARVAQIAAAGSHDWRAALAFLERKYPKRWGKYAGELGRVKRELAELKQMLLTDATPDHETLG